MTDITELAQRARINAECGEHLSPAETLELVEALEKAQTERDEFRNRLKLERSILEDADKRIAELESRTVKLPHRNLGHEKLFLLCPFPYYDAEDMEKALAAAGIKVEAE